MQWDDRVSPMDDRLHPLDDRCDVNEEGVTARNSSRGRNRPRRSQSGATEAKRVRDDGDGARADPLRWALACRPCRYPAWTCRYNHWVVGSVRACITLLLATGCSPSTAGSGGTCQVPPVPTAGPIATGALGDPCATTATACDPGLGCRQMDQVVAGGSFSACTLDCADAACPSGSACIPTGGGDPSCLPTCRDDVDCQASARAGTCVRYGDGGVCEPIACTPPGYGGSAPCPGGFTCVDFVPCGCDPRYPCDETAGWCQGGDGG
jgi:hypothetical protein